MWLLITVLQATHQAPPTCILCGSDPDLAPALLHRLLISCTWPFANAALSAWTVVSPSLFLGTTLTFGTIPLADLLTLTFPYIIASSLCILAIFLVCTYYLALQCIHLLASCT